MNYQRLLNLESELNALHTEKLAGGDVAAAKSLHWALNAISSELAEKVKNENASRETVIKLTSEL